MELTSLKKSIPFSFSFIIKMIFILLIGCQDSGKINNRNVVVKSLKEGKTVTVYKQKWKKGDVGQFPWDPGPPAGEVLVKRLKKETGEEDPDIRLIDPPIKLWYTSPLQEVRWIQIVVKTNPKLANLSRPNFDCCITKGEFNKSDPTSAGAVHRTNRIKDHNPFFALKDDTKFRDKPWQGYNYFETYIILCMINRRTNPDEWQAEIIGVWKWITEHGKEPKLIPTKSNNRKFKKTLHRAKKDFNYGFNFEKWYPNP